MPTVAASAHLPIGLSRGAALERDVPAGERIGLGDVELAAEAHELLPLFG